MAFPNTIHVSSALDSIIGVCNNVNASILAPVPETKSMERGDFLAILTLLQFQHPQYAKILEEIKSLHPGAISKPYGKTIEADLTLILKPYLPMEVSFLEASPSLLKSKGGITRLTATPPDYPLGDIPIGLYRIIVESMSEIDAVTLTSKVHAHQSSGMLCLDRSLKMILMSPVTKRSHRKSSSLSSVFSVFKLSN